MEADIVALADEVWAELAAPSHVDPPHSNQDVL